MSKVSKPIPAWGILSLATNGILLVTVTILLSRQQANESPTAPERTSVATVEPSPTPTPTPTPVPSPEPRVEELSPSTYQERVERLREEVEAIAANAPERLYVLAGDSITLSFPEELLPLDVTWLNQGISGEGSQGLYERLPLLDGTRPDRIFIMIGINDLLRGEDDETILENHRRIIKDILWIHPNTEVVVQSILPHSGEKATWEGREKLREVPNQRIERLNQRLAAIAQVEGATYLNLYPLFVDETGYLNPALTTDGLHLNEQGYELWRIALILANTL
ncbi:GDSL-type esterase/lipase family protein [Phormidium yuhuli AB48]|uniref:GDSL-type esterase/lipase family protein n=1 Tax=Phormidium yuhuli AB48 TaxID=2940671 RepID=A0ABY5ANK4_9CYAN|nr:GDSL-type esterase/lipase family protein [Phormidium yuhuli]USR90400.1 GDSL-type esterase/lipase family protein [Phormidium yuhuli AB48]